MMARHGINQWASQRQAVSWQTMDVFDETDHCSAFDA